MSRGTLGEVIYRVRPAKNVERKMICEALTSLYRIEPLANYQYVGMGSLEFHDFALFYRQLGIGTMVSIEKRDTPDEQARVKFNRPYGHIAMAWGPSHERLPEMSWKKRSIVWLDYDGRVDTEILEDIQLVVSELASGSCLIVTVCGEPLSVDFKENVGKVRLDKLRRAVGKEKVPEGVKGKDLSDWGLAQTYRRIIGNEIESTLSARNAPLVVEKRFEYTQIFNFHYSDGATKMVTCGGIIVSKMDQERLAGLDFEHLSFYRSGAEPYTIKIPRVTVKEARWLSQIIPYGVGNQTKIPKKEVRKYMPIHRYFPEFLEVEPV
ncbi:MAG: hypothetical protein OXI33_08955 [Chloroflexota bacterium]|nr:hypothetical protein [Chloroflexota bacterium]